MSRGLVTRFGDTVDRRLTTGGLTECEGLLLSIIERARQDFLFGKIVWCQTSAAYYFLGPEYKEHKVLLGIPEEWLPAGITVARLKYQLAKGELEPGELVRMLFSPEIRALKKKCGAKLEKERAKIVACNPANAARTILTNAIDEKLRGKLAAIDSFVCGI